MAPRRSRRKAQRHPLALSFHGRTKTRPRTTTTHTPVKRCSAPARTPRILLAAMLARTVAGKRLRGRAGGVGVSAVGGPLDNRFDRVRAIVQRSLPDRTGRQPIPPAHGPQRCGRHGERDRIRTAITGLIAPFPEVRATRLLT